MSSEEKNHASTRNYPCQECWHVICIDSGRRRKNDIRPSRILSSWHDIASMPARRESSYYFGHPAARPPWKELGILIRWLASGCSHIFTNIVIPVSWGLAPLAADHRHILYQKKSLAPAYLLACHGSELRWKSNLGGTRQMRKNGMDMHTFSRTNILSSTKAFEGGSLSFPLTSSSPIFAKAPSSCSERDHGGIYVLLLLRRDSLLSVFGKLPCEVGR